MLIRKYISQKINNLPIDDESAPAPPTEGVAPIAAPAAPPAVAPAVAAAPAVAPAVAAAPAVPPEVAPAAPAAVSASPAAVSASPAVATAEREILKGKKNIIEIKLPIQDSSFKLLKSKNFDEFSKYFKLNFKNFDEFSKYLKSELNKDIESLDIIIKISFNETPDFINYIPLKVKCVPPAIFYRNEECKCELRRITSEKIISTDNDYNSFINKKSIIHLTNLLTGLYFSNSEDKIMKAISSKRNFDPNIKDEELLLEIFKQLLIEKFNTEYENEIECKTIIEEFLKGTEKKNRN